MTNASTGDGIGQVTWLFAVNNALREGLGAGEVLVQTYTVEIADGHGGTDSQLVTITINGTNDAAVITGDSIGAVVEAGGVDNDIPGTPTDSGDLNSTDVDDADDAWTAVGSQTASANGYGTFTITGAGVWTYTLDNTNAAVQGIPASGTLADSFTVATTDGTSQVVSITITGANDAPVAADDGNGGDAVTESGVAAGDPSAAGNVLTNDIDVDTGDTKTVTVVNGSALNVGQPLVGTYGTLTLLADGSWTYALNNADPDTDALVQGQAATDVFTYTMADANGATSSAALTIAITGANDAPVAVDDSNGGDAVIESGVNPGDTPFAGDPSATGNVLTNDTDVDTGDTRTVTAVNGSAPNVGAPLVGLYGTLTLLADGSWTYALNNADLDTNALAQGQAASDAFTYTVTDANGGSSTAALTITITGTNDAPVAVADGNGADAVIETGVVAGDPSATGNVLTNDTDVDTSDTKTVTAVNGAAVNVGQPLVGIYGTLTLLADGSWSYALNNADPDTDALRQGQIVTDAFTYTMADANGATSSAALTITVTGGNDAPVAVDDSNGADAVIESGVVVGDPSAAGNVLTNDTDVDTSDTKTVTAVNGAAVNVGQPLVGIYGTLTLMANGTWSYALNDADPDTNALAQGQAASDAFSYTIADANGASSTAALTIAITGANDAPVAVADGNGSDAVTESGVVAGDPSAAGNVLTNDTDVDTGDSRTVTAVNGLAPNVGAPLVGTYGTLTLGANGTWTYTLNDADPETNALAQGQVVTDAFSYTVSDANGAASTAALTITITGGNDAPVVTGAVDSGTVTEGSLPVMTADGTIDFGDVDLTDVHVTSVTPGGTGYLGTFVANVTNASTSDGVGQVTWLFAANNVLRQSLGAGQVLVQTYTVVIDDGLGGTDSQLVTVTINGTNDAAVITGETTGAVVEAGGVNNAIPGTPTDSGDLNATDVDDPADSWEVVSTPTASTNGYGTFTITAAGVWTYTLDNSHPAVQALPAGGPLADSFTVATIDGTSQVVSITITGSNDAPVAVADSNGGDAVTESGIAAGAPSAAATC